MRIARLLCPVSILGAIFIITSNYSKWGFGAILAGIGFFSIGSFLSYLFSGGRNLSEIPSERNYHFNTDVKDDDEMFLFKKNYFEIWKEKTDPHLYEVAERTNNQFTKAFATLLVAQSIKVIPSIVGLFEEYGASKSDIKQLEKKLSKLHVSECLAIMKHIYAYYIIMFLKNESHISFLKSKGIDPIKFENELI